MSRLFTRITSASIVFTRLHHTHPTTTRLLLLVLVTVLLTVVARPCLMLMALPHALPAPHELPHPAPVPDDSAPCHDSDCATLAAVEQHQPKRAMLLADGLHLPVLALLCWLLPLLLLWRLWRVLLPPLPLSDCLPPPLRFRVLLI